MTDFPNSQSSPPPPPPDSLVLHNGDIGANVEQSSDLVTQPEASPGAPRKAKHPLVLPAHGYQVVHLDPRTALHHRTPVECEGGEGSEGGDRYKLQSNDYGYKTKAFTNLPLTRTGRPERSR